MTSLNRRIRRNRKQRASSAEAAAAAPLFGPVPRELSRLAARDGRTAASSAPRPVLRVGQQPRTPGLRSVGVPQIPVPQELRDALRSLAQTVRAQGAPVAPLPRPVDTQQAPKPQALPVPHAAVDAGGWPIVVPFDEDPALVGFLNTMVRRVHSEADRLARAFDQRATALCTHMQVWARRRSRQLAGAEGRHLAAAYEIGGTEAYQGLAAEVRAMMTANALAGV